MNVLRDLGEDVRFYHALHRPGRAPTLASLLRVAATSRGLVLLAHHRIAAAITRRRPGARTGRVAAAGSLAAALLEYVVCVVTRSEVRSDSRVEPRVYLSDRGHVFLGARRIGRGTVIHEGVTIGRSALRRGSPDIGRDVWIGHDCVIAGDIRVGDGATILPHTVLTRSVPAGFVASGNPAQFIRRGFDNASLRRTLAPRVHDLAAERTTG